MKKHHILFFLCLCMIARSPAFAQTLKRLEPVSITSMTEVKRDTIEQYDREGRLIFRGLPKDIFYQCFNGEDTVGYLIQPADTASLLFQELSKNGHPVKVGLRELNLAEAIFANSLDNMVDSAHQVPRCFTSLRFYDYQRQYVFYQDDFGDTCVYINCYILPGDDWHPEQHFISVSDGGDYFWYARLNLSKGKLTSYEVNEGYDEGTWGRKSRTSCGRTEVSVFDGFPTYPEIPYNSLPKTVRKLVIKKEVSQIESITTPSQTFYRIRFHNGSVKGYDANGECLFVRFDQKVSSRMIYHDAVPNFDSMLDAIDADMADHGYDFRRDGMLRRVNTIDGDWRIIVDMWKSGKQLMVVYTINSTGQIIGRYICFF